MCVSSILCTKYNACFTNFPNLIYLIVFCLIFLSLVTIFEILSRILIDLAESNLARRNLNVQGHFGNMYIRIQLQSVAFNIVSFTLNFMFIHQKPQKHSSIYINISICLSLLGLLTSTSSATSVRVTSVSSSQIAINIPSHSMQDRA